MRGLRYAACALFSAVQCREHTAALSAVDWDEPQFVHWVVPLELDGPKRRDVECIGPVDAVQADGDWPAVVAGTHQRQQGSVEADYSQVRVAVVGTFPEATRKAHYSRHSRVQERAEQVAAPQEEDCGGLSPL